MRTVDTYQNRCSRCDYHLFGRESCPFCEACAEIGIVNGRDSRERRARRGEMQ